MTDASSWQATVTTIGTTVAGVITACGAVWVGLYRGKAEINVSALNEARLGQARAEVEVGRLQQEVAALKGDIVREEEAHRRARDDFEKRYSRTTDLLYAWQRTASDYEHTGNNQQVIVARLGSSGFAALPPTPGLEDIEQWRQEGGVKGHMGATSATDGVAGEPKS